MNKEFYHDDNPLLWERIPVTYSIIHIENWEVIQDQIPYISSIEFVLHLYLFISPWEYIT